MNRTQDWLNRKLVEGKYYLVVAPNIKDILVMKYHIYNEDSATDFAQLSDEDHIFNDVYHRDIKVFDIQIPIEVQNEKNMLAYNREIVVILADLVEEHPDWRFQQLLQNVGIIHKVMENGVSKIIDSYYEPSAETLFNLKDIINQS